MSEEDLQDEVTGAMSNNEHLRQSAKMRFEADTPEDFKKYRDVKRGRKSSVDMGGNDNGPDFNINP